MSHTKSKPPNITLLLLLEKWSVSAMARGWKRQEGRRTIAWLAAAKTWFLVWLLVWLGLLVCAWQDLQASQEKKARFVACQEGKASLRSTGHNSTMRSSQGKGRSEKGQDFPPSLQNQNKQANKERTKQKQGAKAGQVTEKRGEKGRERSSFHPSPSHALSRSISSISSNSISALALALTYLVTASIPSPSPWFFFFVCFGHKAKERRLEEDTSYLPSHATNVNCRG